MRDVLIGPVHLAAHARGHDTQSIIRRVTLGIDSWVVLRDRLCALGSSEPAEATLALLVPAPRTDSKHVHVDPRSTARPAIVDLEWHYSLLCVTPHRA